MGCALNSGADITGQDRPVQATQRANRSSIVGFWLDRERVDGGAVVAIPLIAAAVFNSTRAALKSGCRPLLSRRFLLADQPLGGQFGNACSETISDGA